MITEGVTARQIKNVWVTDSKVSHEAFNLREENTPPEEYVSFSMTSGESLNDQIESALADLRNRRRGKLKGYIALFDIEECLESINDEREPLIEFRDQDLPHCGLYYITQDDSKILEAKNTLSLLANFSLHPIPNNRLQQNNNLVTNA